MILESITLNNFRSYQGEHEIELRPVSAEQPIVLFTGLNGSGKTSLLEALYLALYGKLTPSTRRENTAYNDYLGGCIHQQVDPADGAAIELKLTRRAGGKEETFTVHRSWCQSGKTVREELDVLRNGEQAPVLGEEWAQFIEEILPSKLAPLFFFDGEKIEALADLEAATSVLKVAIHSLLGLDLVDQLGADLKILERRAGQDLKEAPDRARLKELERLLDAAKAEEEKCYRLRAEVRTDLERAEELLRRADEEFSAEGGTVYEKRQELEADRAECYRALDEARERLKTLAAGSAPLLLVESLLERTHEQSLTEAEKELDEALVEVLERRDATLLKRLSKLGADSSLLKATSKFLEQERSSWKGERETEVHLKMSSEERHRLGHLLDGGLSRLQEEVTSGLNAYQTERDRCDAAERRLAAVPEEGAIRELREARDKARWEVEQLVTRLEERNDHYETAVREREAREKELAREMERHVESDFAHEDSARLVNHSRKVRGTLSELRERVLERHLERISSLVLEGFQQLVRKERLVEDLEIGLEDFSLRLWGSDGLRLDPGQLSAGERQLLAVALLWGLARAAGRPVPTLIDTPLGRLDSTHRIHLVERYFPHASHQVILLSTDEEIRDDYLESLRQSIGRSYVLEFDDNVGATTVREGWLEN